LAARAYQRADRLAGGRSVDALTGLAEALSMSDETELDGRAGRLLEQALEVDPRSPKALYYGALAALRRSDLPVARQRFATLLDLGAPDNIRPLLKRQIDMLDAQIKAGPAKPGQAAGAAPRVQVNVSVAPAMRAHIDVSAPLFVIVREPGVRGPPLAVKRLTSRFPQSVELTAADAMIEGRTFQSGQSIEVVARIARSGNPVGTTGDPFGLIATRVGDSGVLNLAIDRLTP
jgi:cytochrome c-type biogenesis protein CcmH